MKKKTKLKEVALNLKVPGDLKNWFTVYAHEQNRSLNGQVNLILKNFKEENEEA